MREDIGGEEAERIMASVLKKHKEAGSSADYMRSVADQKRKTRRYLTQRNKAVSANKIPVVSDLIARVKAEINIRRTENRVGGVISAYEDLIKKTRCVW